MNAEHLIQRATLLMQQGRFPLAEETLRQALIGAPDHAPIHAYLALCLAQDRDRLPAAEQAAAQAVHRDPTSPLSFYALTVVRAERGQLSSALESIATAIQIDPENAEYYGLQASLWARQNQWTQALRSAEQGLAYDPDHSSCSGLRSLALERLGRVTDALGEADRAIRHNPDSADAHASRGWALLNQGDYRAAQVSFREALRLEPANDFARSGMISAINSGNFLFRWFSRIFQFLSRLDSRWQIGLVIGAWFLMRTLNQAAQNNPSLAPWVLPILGLYLLLVLMSWIMQPLFNTALRFHPFGKYLLSHREKWASNLISGTLAWGAATGAIASIRFFDPLAIALNMIFAFQMTIPLAIALNTTATWARNLATGFTIAFGILFLTITLGVCFDFVIEWTLTTFLTGILIYSFAGQSLILARPRY